MTADGSARPPGPQNEFERAARRVLVRLIADDVARGVYGVVERVEP